MTHEKKKNGVCVMFTDFFFILTVVSCGDVFNTPERTVPRKETPQEYYLFLTEHGFPLHIHLKEDSCIVVDIT